MKLFYAKIFCFLILFSYNSALLCAQSGLDSKAPTLQIGLDGFSFAKGSLDAQLIMEIVAQKQQELKVKTIQNVFLSKVENAGGTVYSFTDNVVRELVFEADQNVRTRKILENTINLVFVVAYLEYYINNIEGTAKISLLNLSQTSDFRLYDKKELNLNDFIKPKTGDITKFYNDTSAVNFIALLIDMSSLVVRQDQKLKQLGLMQISYSETYEFMNEYLKLSLSENSIDKSKLDNLQVIFKDMKLKLESITNYIGLVNFISEERTFRFDQNDFFGIKSLDSIKNKPPKPSVSQLKINTKALITEITKITPQDSVITAEITNLYSIYFYLEKAEKALTSDETIVFSDILYTLNSEFIPLLKKQSYRHIDYLKLIESFNETNDCLFEFLLYGNKLLQKHTNKVPQFILLSSKLYQFDRSVTISEYLKLIDEIGTIFPNDNIKNALSTVITFVKDYTVIEKTTAGKEVINFNLESFLVKLQNIKPYTLRRTQFLFSVGVNNAMFNTDITLDDGSIIRNLSFVSEKIGIKYKLFDFAFSKTRNPGETYQVKYGPYTVSYINKLPPKEPIISNIHLLAYGSGILYNLVNTKTSKEFNMPLIGVGGGLTFFNGLDFNVSWGVPIFNDQPISTKYSYWNAGFDIQFIEYFNKLQEKRSANQVQKKLVEAQK